MGENLHPLINNLKDPFKLNWRDPYSKGLKLNELELSCQKGFSCKKLLVLTLEVWSQPKILKWPNLE